MQRRVTPYIGIVLKTTHRHVAASFWLNDGSAGSIVDIGRPLLQKTKEIHSLKPPNFFIVFFIKPHRSKTKGIRPIQKEAEPMCRP